MNLGSAQILKRNQEPLPSPGWSESNDAALGTEIQPSCKSSQTDLGGSFIHKDRAVGAGTGPILASTHLGSYHLGASEPLETEFKVLLASLNLSFHFYKMENRNSSYSSQTCEDSGIEHRKS